MNLIRSRINDRDDSGFAMMFTILLTIIIMTASITVAAIMTHQVTPGLFSKKIVRTVDAASAGMNTALSQLRSAQNANSGDLTQLPCSDPSDQGGVSIQTGSPATAFTVPGDEVDGTVANNGVATNTTTYRAVIVYFSVDPTSHETDSSSAWWLANAIGCKAGLAKTVPSYAFIQSFGAGVKVANLTSATSGNRTIHATYQFSTTNSNLSGGNLAEFNLGAPRSMCMDAGSAPTINTVPTMQPCKALGSVSQTWQYRSDLSIYYGGDTTANLCLQNVSGVAKLETCTSATNTPNTTTYPYLANQLNQEWNYNDGGQLEIANSDGSVGGGSPGPCLEGSGVSTSTAAVTGASMVVVTCSGSSGDLTAWKPDPQMGAGKSGGNYTGVPGTPTNQYVNYALFGNCVDVNGQYFPNKLIAYPCKQAPNTNSLTWNQLWHFTLVSGNYGEFYTTCPANTGGCVTPNAAAAQNDCLVSPGTVNGLVYGANCPTAGVPPDNMLWQATGKIPGNYDNSYLLVNKADNMCLAVDPSQASVGFPQIVVTPCDGSQIPSTGTIKNPLLMKWNSPASVPAPGVANEQEDNGSSYH